MNNWHKALFSARFRTTFDAIWHKCFAHPQSLVVHFLSNKGLVTIDGQNQFRSVCDSCQMSKSSKLPFVHSSDFSLEVLSKIHTGLWGLAPVTSFQLFKYYVSFIDDCTCFTRIYPLKRKSNFYACSLQFQRMVENQFDKKKSRFFNQMVEVNFQIVNLQNIYMSVESYTKCLILELQNKMELLNVNIDISLNLG